MLSVVLYRGMAGQFSGRHYDAVEGASLYWHFVDVVWILLFSLLYLLPGKSGVDRRMHPLRHPRNAALVGIIFIVIAIVYYVVPTLDGPDRRHVRHRRRDDDAGLPRRGDGDHGLRARRRVDGRVTRSPSAARPDRDDRCSNELWTSILELTAQFVIARLGRDHRASSRSGSSSSSWSSCCGSSGA